MPHLEDRLAGGDDLRPIIFLVDADDEAREAMAAVLDRRFGADYRVITVSSATAGIEELARLAREGADIALVAADHRLTGMDGVEFLERARGLHRSAFRALLIAMDERGTRIPFGALGEIQRATALGRIDLWLVKGTDAPEELVYPHIQEALTIWTRANRPRHMVLRMVGEQRSPRSHALRETMGRNTVPFGFYPVHSDEGRRLMRDHDVDPARLPALILRNGTVLHDPSDVEVAAALGVRTRPSSSVYDLAVIGAGPAGLAAAVYGASEGLRTLVVEELAVGGQAGTSSMIRNYLGFPRGLSGGELAFRAFEQTLIFGTEFLFTRQVTGLAARDDVRALMLAGGEEVTARAVVIASGVSYRRLGIPSLERLAGAGVYYGAAGVEAPAMAGEEVYVVGGANSAGQAALHLAGFADRVTLLIRGDSLAAGMSDYLVQQIEAATNVAVRLRTRIVDGGGGERLQTLTLEEVSTGRREEVPAAAVFVMIGAEPHTTWLPESIRRDQKGFILAGADVPREAWPLDRPLMPFETSLPGVFAVGDVRAGSVKRVAGAVGEGSVAIGSVHRYLADLPAASAGSM